MTTLSADVTPKMVEWIDEKVKKGFYKSRSEVIRELVREEMKQKEYPQAAASERVLKKIWANEPDGLWESYL
ncbi:ribbon-helix-helix domain-containing protein [Candidatus Micrarchaeota archaeon]|nr:ribbon-helix-helix domain-containing protein [Candidatus Micrarchaeota archaeon]MBU2476828.1 ribbon-helix-helix domain-containing protein [Candidatus Micrarchaeota archaeon]